MNYTSSARLGKKVLVDESGCWLWLGYIDRAGYGRVCWLGRSGRAAHRVIYALLVAPIPAGLTLDHLCRVTACVNPAHLEPVTALENIARGGGKSARAVRGDPCKRGHTYQGGDCQPCNALHHRLARAKWTPEKLEAHRRKDRERARARRRERAA